MPDLDDLTKPTRSSRARRWIGWTALGVGVVALLAGIFRVVRWLDAKDDAMVVCRSLEKEGAVTKCVLQRGPVAYGVQAEQVVRFEVKYEGHRAYWGTLARLRDPGRVGQFLKFAAEADRKSARKTAAAAEIGSGGKLSGASLVAQLAPVQIANLGRRLAVDLKPVYGGPQQAVSKQVAAIRKRVMQ
jgi:hypothetical protein